jgi:hypothetical protein
MSNGIYIILGLAVILVIILIRGAIALHNIAKLQTAKKELREMPIDEWESKWGEFVQKEYDKCDDPHRQEMEECMEFFKQFIRESEKGGQDGRD